MPPTFEFKPFDPDLLRAVAVIAIVRWGPTGFRCPGCGCTEWRSVSARPRVRRCADCHRQVSVTSGTPLMYAKIDLARLVAFLEVPDFRTPTVSEVQEQLGVSRTTAHYVLVRILRVYRRLARAAGEPLQRHVQGVLFRRAARPMVPYAPPEIQELDRRRHTDRRVRVVLELATDVREAIVEESVGCGVRTPGVPHVEHRGFRRWLRAQFDRGRRVSLRWMPDWLTAATCHWNIGCERSPVPDLFSELLATPHLARHRSDPWRAIDARGARRPAA